MTTLLGRRLPDTEFGNLPKDPRPGDFWKYLVDGVPMKATDYGDGDSGRAKGNLENTVWGFYSPDGNGMGTLVYHTVREHDDGLISILPGDGSSNSVKHSGGALKKEWHGYVYHGVWTPV